MYQNTFLKLLYLAIKFIVVNAKNTKKNVEK